MNKSTTGVSPLRELNGFSPRRSKHSPEPTDQPDGDRSKRARGLFPEPSDLAATASAAAQALPYRVPPLVSPTDGAAAAASGESSQSGPLLQNGASPLDDSGIDSQSLRDRREGLIASSPVQVAPVALVPPAVVAPIVPAAAIAIAPVVQFDYPGTLARAVEFKTNQGRWPNPGDRMPGQPAIFTSRTEMDAFWNYHRAHKEDSSKPKTQAQRNQVAIAQFRKGQPVTVTDKGKTTVLNPKTQKSITAFFGRK